MKITFDRKSFLRRLKLAVSAVPVKGYVPMLDNVKLTACTESIILQATDTITSIRITLDCSGADFSVIEKGQILIPAKNISKILEKSREKTLTLELDDAKIIMSGVSERHEFDVNDPDEFPDVVIPDTSSCHVVRADTMSNAIKRTIFSTDKDNRKYALLCVLCAPCG
jgi:DNA polymerase III sliding clamp (beta) subunit (PCNA family)